MTSGAAAGRYARALFDVATKERVDVEKVQSDLQQFVSLFAQHPVPVRRVADLGVEL